VGNATLKLSLQPVYQRNMLWQNLIAEEKWNVVIDDQSDKKLTTDITK